jgi:amino acid permease
MNAIRTALVLLNVAVAVHAPYFGGMLSAVGGLTDAFLCFVLPPMIYRCALRDDMSGLLHGLYLCIVVWGFLVIGHTLWHVVELSMEDVLGM